MSSSALCRIIVEASWQGSLVIVLILLLRPVLGRRVPARWRFLLWSLVLKESRRVWQRCCERVAAGHRPEIIQTGAVNSPALVGVFRPKLLLPARGCETLAAEDWEHVFLHELAHFRRRDHWTQLVLLLALCVHWFNPLVWLGFRFLRADRELAADEWALRHLDARRSVGYGETLLKVLTAHSRHALTPGLVGIVEDGAQIKQRLRHIVAFTPRRLTGSLAGIAVVLALGAVVLGRPAADLAGYEGLAPAESLIVAARRGDREAVEQLLHDGADVNSVVKMRGERTALTEAVAAHDLELIRLFVDKGADVQLQPGHGSAPLVVALKKGWPEIADYLRSQGATCSAEILAAASNDAAAVEKYLATGERSYEQVKLLGEVAAAHGHRTLFATLWDALKQLPRQGDYFPFSRDTFAVAVANGHREVIEELLERDPNLTPHEGVVRLAAAADRRPGLREWLDSKGVKVPEYTDGERLIDAAEREDLPSIRRLLDAGVDIHFRGEADWTPLTKAATWGCPRAVALLLERGADPNGRRYNNYSTLELAKTPEIADLLFRAGAKVTPKDINYCVTFGSVELVQWFLDHGVDPLKFTDADGSQPTLLFHAGKPEIAELLIARGVDVNAKNKFGRTALVWALQMHSNSPKLLETLLRHGADPNERMQGGITPLMQAQDGPSVDALVAAGADLDAVDDRGHGVLYTGWGSGIPSRLEALRRHGLKLDPVKGGELLCNAVMLQGDLGAVKRLLAMGIDPNAESFWEGRPVGTALNAAISNGKFEIAAALRAAGANDVGRLSEAAAKGDVAQMIRRLDAGAPVDETASNGATPLHFAVHQGQVEAVKLLLARGANVNLFTATGYTALDSAGLILGSVEHGNYSPIDRLKVPEAKVALDEIVAAIRAQNPNRNFRNAAGETALMCSASVGGILADLSQGLDVNAQRPDGMTALLLAIASQPKNASKDGPGSVGTDVVNGEATRWMSARAHFVRTLLERGADLTLRNKNGKTALDLARESGNEEILALLQAAPEKAP